ncbi:LLM class flavin-dependent oxidoreductase [Mycobacterium sp. E1747]|uniref:LLM class flavin-dependent oxidoreductase n=1 Tax=Mycobacterium sp. E1747 TaxID=1834128 RepID=UPI0007FBA9E6|nr:LLM class flavin-dependent oxidoreductase [Mycobacterium sp. E1747]OBH11145.1 hypothetical protein A5695_20270 [Mycobacterium sp. E1747]
MQSPMTTGIPIDNHRATPLAQVGELAKTLGAKPEFDYLWFFDEISGWFHRSLWVPENAPMASVRDNNSTHDPFIEAAFALAANPDAGIRLTADAVRTRPGEMVRSLMSLGSAAQRQGQVVYVMGAGESRQIRPLGYPSGQGLGRLEDLFRLYHLLWERDEPFSFEGNHWRLDHAYLGETRPAVRPEYWALGGGPKLISIAARYADGLEAAAPNTFVTPDDWARMVTDVRNKVEAAGRDPDAFGFGLWLGCQIHEDRDVLEASYENPCMKYLAAILGRFNQSDWRRDGIEPVMPDDWHYARRWLPFKQSADEVRKIVDAVPPDMVRKAAYGGSPAQIASIAQEFVDAGATYVGLIDFMPLVLDGLTDPPFGRWAEVCGTLHATAGK